MKTLPIKRKTSFKSAVGSLVISVFSARNVVSSATKSSNEFYCSVHVGKAKRKTHPSASYSWNENLQFDKVEENGLITLKLKEKIRLAGNHTLGKVQLPLFLVPDSNEQKWYEIQKETEKTGEVKVIGEISLGIQYSASNKVIVEKAEEHEGTSKSASLSGLKRMLSSDRTEKHEISSDRLARRRFSSSNTAEIPTVLPKDEPLPLRKKSASVPDNSKKSALRLFGRSKHTQAQIEKKNTAFRVLFGLPDSETIVIDLTAGLMKTLKLSPFVGRLCASQNYICYYADVFGVKSVDVIKFTDVASLEKKRDPDLSIQIQTHQNSRYSFNILQKNLETEKAVDLLCSMWNGNANKENTATITSINDETTEVETPVPCERDTENVTNDLESVEQGEEESEDEEAFGDFDEQNHFSYLVEVLNQEFNVNVAEFFQRFFSEHFDRLFHQKVGDTISHLEPWSNQPPFGNVRELQYTTSFDSSKGNTVSCTVSEFQRYHFTTSDHLVIEMTALYQANLGDYRLEGRWDVTNIAVHRCQLVVSVDIKFINKTKSSKIASLRKKLFKNSKQKIKSWASLAHEQLENEEDHVTTSSDSKTRSKSPFRSGALQPLSKNKSSSASAFSKSASSLSAFLSEKQHRKRTVTGPPVRITYASTANLRSSTPQPIRSGLHTSLSLPNPNTNPQLQPSPISSPSTSPLHSPTLSPHIASPSSMGETKTKAKSTTNTDSVNAAPSALQQNLPISSIQLVSSRTKLSSSLIIKLAIVLGTFVIWWLYFMWCLFQVAERLSRLEQALSDQLRETALKH